VYSAKSRKIFHRPLMGREMSARQGLKIRLPSKIGVSRFVSTFCQKGAKSDKIDK
jgi:hypothetical protein